MEETLPVLIDSVGSSFNYYNYKPGVSEENRVTAHRDNHGQPLLPPSYACVSAMEKNMKARCEYDNYAYNTFHI
eukprot:4215349-Ditylum_brightwellii.AAC.1